MSGAIIFWISLPITIVLIFFIAYYWRSCDPTIKLTDKLDFTAKTIFASVALVSLFVAYQTLRINIHKERVKAAFDFLQRYDKQEERDAREKIDALFLRTGEMREYLNDDIPSDRIKGFHDTLTTEDEKAARIVMSFFEDLALSVRAGYALESIAYRSLGPGAIRFINGLRPFIKKTHNKTGESLYYDDALHLFNCWKRKMSVHQKAANLK